MHELRKFGFSVWARIGLCGPNLLAKHYAGFWVAQRRLSTAFPSDLRFIMAERDYSAFTDEIQEESSTECSLLAGLDQSAAESDTDDSCCISDVHVPPLQVAPQLPCRRAHKKPNSSTDPFSIIPGELLSRILFNLSAEDLTASAAQVCKSFRAAANDGLLWKHMYRLRWDDEAQADEKMPWKAAYMQRDKVEVYDVQRRICRPEMQSLYIQMIVGRRSNCLRPSAVEAALRGPIANSNSLCLANWRRSRGFASIPLHAQHKCTQSSTFTKIVSSVPPLYMCEQCGWAHACDDKCRERIMVNGSGGGAAELVCPISGFCSRAILTDVEEAAQQQGDDGAEEIPGEAGRLARAWTDGYGCSDESELFQLTGGRLTR